LQTSSYLASDRHGRHGYYFDGDAIRALRRIEALRTLCDDDLAGIKIILDLSAALERTRSQIRSLWREKSSADEKAGRPGVNSFVWKKNKREVEL